MNAEQSFSALRGEAGVALPVALLGLISMTILVTGVLVTSATESGISAAHQGAVSSLYNVDHGLEAYVGQEGAALTVTPAGGVSFTPQGATAPLNVNVSHLGFSATLGPNGSNLYAVQVAGQNGGRRVGAMVRVPLVIEQWNVSVEQAFAAGSERVRIGGSSFISGNQDAALCTEGENVKAVTLSTEATHLNIQESSIDGDINEQVVQSGLTRYELEKQILGGMTTREFARYADIKFGDFRVIDRKDGVDGQVYPSFETSQRPNSDPGQANYANPQLTPYNWGCPIDVILRANEEASQPGSGSQTFDECQQDGDENHTPFVAINGHGGDVVLSGDHGQGILLIFNGNLRLQGRFVYKGMIIVDGMTDIRGGGGEYKIEGALIGFGDVTMDDPNDDGSGSSDVLGNAVIRYNSCAIAMAKQHIDETFADDPRQTIPERTFSWFELLR
jgi:hypothetical protein